MLLGDHANETEVGRKARKSVGPFGVERQVMSEIIWLTVNELIFLAGKRVGEADQEIRGGLKYKWAVGQSKPYADFKPLSTSTKPSS